MMAEDKVELSRDAIRLIAGEMLSLGLCRGFLYEVISQLDSTHPLHAKCQLLLECTSTSALLEKLEIQDKESGIDWNTYLTPLEIEKIKLGQ